MALSNVVSLLKYRISSDIKIGWTTTSVSSMKRKIPFIETLEKYVRIILVF